MRYLIALTFCSLTACAHGPQDRTDLLIMMPELPSEGPTWLVGMRAEDVIARLGPPAQRKPGLLDYQSATCDFSIFLRPNAQGVHRVFQYHTMNKSGDTAIDPLPCLKQFMPEAWTRAQRLPAPR